MTTFPQIGRTTLTLDGDGVREEEGQGQEQEDLVIEEEIND